MHFDLQMCVSVAGPGECHGGVEGWGGAQLSGHSTGAVAGETRVGVLRRPAP